MNSIVNIEDRLHIVKQLIELQIKVGAQFDTIILSTKYQNWEQNDFRAKCLGANLNDLKQLKILENILSLSDEIMNLFLNLPKNVPYLNRTTSYKFEGIPYGAKFSDFLLTKKEDGKRYNFVTQENTFSVLKKGTWEETWHLMKEEHWKDCSIFEIMGENISENLKDKKMYLNMQFFEFVKNINLFLVEYVFIENYQTDKKTFADYLSAKNKDAIIAKIQECDRKTPNSIFIILKALLDGGILLMSDNNTIYEAYYNQFGYSKSFDTLKRGLNYHDWNNVDKKLLEKIEIMTIHLCD